MTEAERLALALQMVDVGEDYIDGMGAYLVGGGLPSTVQGVMGYADLQAMVNAAGPFCPEAPGHRQPNVTRIPVYTLDNPLHRRTF